ncbi:MAG: DUF3343 domain-containing protein [Clostridia bacterium]|jgi:hypothetical protein|nr:DUF3343 domain-containing protein [Clostridia bacterium]MDH7572617.1 DUF3343 domain-containing protein [Clostridia bacterium]
MGGERVTFFTFPSTHYALKAEKAARQAGVRVRLVPVPRELSSLCGLALEVDTEHELAALEALAGVKLERKARVIREAGLITALVEVVDFEPQ